MTTKTTEPIVVTVSLNASPERVWKAITDPAQMRRWFFEQMETFEAKPGFKTRFTVRNGGRDFIHCWHVTAVSENRRIAYDWKYAGCAGDSRVDWEISPEGARTTLTLTHEGGDTFPQDVQEFRRENCQAGWNYFLGERLKQFLG